MQNLPLLHLKTSSVFYSRKLGYNVSGIHNLGDDSVKMYRYCEHEGRKGPNEVTSMILDYLNNIQTDCDDQVLLRDGCPGQNKNKTKIQFLFCLVLVLKLFQRTSCSSVLHISSKGSHPGLFFNWLKKKSGVY